MALLTNLSVIKVLLTVCMFLFSRIFVSYIFENYIYTLSNNCTQTFKVINTNVFLKEINYLPSFPSFLPSFLPLFFSFWKQGLIMQLQGILELTVYHRLVLNSCFSCFYLLIHGIAAMMCQTYQAKNVFLKVQTQCQHSITLTIYDSFTIHL